MGARSNLDIRLRVLASFPLLVVVHGLLGNDDYSALSHLSAIILGLVAAGTWYAYLSGKEIYRRAPVLEFYISYQYSLYGLAVFFPQVAVTNREIYPRSDSYELAGFVAAASAIAFIIGFGFARRPLAAIRVGRWLPELSDEALDRAATPFLVVTAICLLLQRYDFFGTYAGVVAAVFSRTTNFALQFYLFLALPSARTRIRFLFAILIQVALFFFHSSLEDLAQVFVVALVGYFWLKNRFHLGLAIAGVVAFLVLQPMKGYYREYAWRGDTKAGEIQDQGSAADGWEYAYDRIKSQRDDEKSDSARATLGRLSELPTLAFTVENVPSVVPFQRAEPTLDAIVIGTIPRLLWPGKPSMTAIGGAQFTQVVGITTWEQDQYTATSFPLASHGYLLSGFLGAIFWSVLLGMLARFYTSLLEANVYRTVLGIAFAVMFSRNLTLIIPFASVWQQVVAWFAFSLFVLVLARIRSLRHEAKTAILSSPNHL